MQTWPFLSYCMLSDLQEFRLRIGYETPDEEAIRPETGSKLQHLLSMTGWHPLLDPAVFPWPGPY